MENAATPYPVIFFDGEQEQDRGFIGVHSLLTFKGFQSLLSHKIGIPPNQLSVVFICRRTLKASDKRQRLPINGSTNFNILINQHNPSKERDCYFLVSLRKSKKEPRRSRKRGVETDSYERGSSGGLEGIRDQNPLSHCSAGSNYLLEASSPPISSYMTPQRPMYGNMNHNKIMDYGNERTVLKRSNTSGYPKQVHNNVGAPAFMPATSKGLDRILPSPFTTFHQGDPRNANGIQDTFQRRANAPESWGLQSFYAPSYNAAAQADSPYNYESGNMIFQEGRQSHRLLTNGGSEFMGRRAYRHNGLQEPVYLNMYGNGGFLKPDAFASRISPSSDFPVSRETGPEQPHNQNFQGTVHPNILLGGSWQMMPATVGSIPNFRDSIVNRSSNENHEEESQSFCCQFCYDCKKKNVSPIPFHGCVEDTITKGFQGPSPAGPIGRRTKMNHIEVSCGGIILAA